MSDFSFYNINKAPQLELPDDVVIHYIVKDYQRMFHANEKMLEALKKLKEELQKRDRRIEDLEKILGIMKDSDKNVNMVLEIKSLREKVRKLKESNSSLTYQLAQSHEKNSI